MKPHTTLTLIVIFLTCVIPQSSAQEYPLRKLLPGTNPIDRLTVTDMKKDANEHLWLTFGTRKSGSTVNTSENGLAHLNGNTWELFNTSNSGIPTNNLTCVAFQNSTIWIGSNDGLIQKDGNNWKQFATHNSGLLSDTINDILVTGGILWIATNNGLTQKIGESYTTFHTLNSNLPSNKITCIAKDKDGTIWAGTKNGLCKLIPGSFQVFTTLNSGLNSNRINTLHLDSKNQLWIGTDTTNNGKLGISPGLHVLTKNGIIDYLTFLGVCADKKTSNLNNINRIASNSSGSIFVTCKTFDFLSSASNLSLIEINNKKSYTFNTKDNVSSANRFIVSLSTGNIAYLSRDTLVLFNPAAYKPGPSKLVTPAAYLDINKVSAPIITGGDMLWDIWGSNYEVPKNSCKNAIFTSALWIGGMHNQDIHLAAETYRQTGRDYTTGPLNKQASSDSSTQDFYNKLWRVNRQSIEQFKLDFGNGKIQNRTALIPEAIATWPAHGDTSKGFAFYLAPFIDLNSDGKYNPMDGDYPRIKGDQSVFRIINDKPYLHGESQGLPLGFEIHASAYSFVCDAIKDSSVNAALNYTTFYHFKIYNRSGNSYTQSKIGLWTAIELGDYSDDYIACNPAENYAIGYNGDANDGIGHVTHYGVAPPAIAQVLLRGVQTGPNQYSNMSNFMYYNNDYSKMGNPQRPEHYFNLMNNKWKNDSQTTYGSVGMGGNDPTNFVFPMNYIPGKPMWSEASANIAPGDRRYVMATEAGTINPGDSLEIEYAIVWSRQQDTTNWPNPILNKLQADVRTVKSWYEQQNFPSCLDLKTGLRDSYSGKESAVTIYPNPAQSAITIQTPSQQATYKIYDITGRLQQEGESVNGGSIDIQKLSSGLYFINVKYGGKTVSVKFLKE